MTDNLIHMSHAQELHPPFLGEDTARNKIPNPSHRLLVVHLFHLQGHTKHFRKTATE